MFACSKKFVAGNVAPMRVSLVLLGDSEHFWRGPHPRSKTLRLLIWGQHYADVCMPNASCGLYHAFGRPSGGKCDDFTCDGWLFSKMFESHHKHCDGKHMCDSCFGSLIMGVELKQMLFRGSKGLLLTNGKQEVGAGPQHLGQCPPHLGSFLSPGGRPFGWFVSTICF